MHIFTVFIFACMRTQIYTANDSFDIQSPNLMFTLAMILHQSVYTKHFTIQNAVSFDAFEIHSKDDTNNIRVAIWINEYG